MSARTYYEKIAFPLVRKLKNVIRSVLLRYFEKTQEMQIALDLADSRVMSLSAQVEKDGAGK